MRRIEPRLQTITLDDLGHVSGGGSECRAMGAVWDQKAQQWVLTNAYGCTKEGFQKAQREVVWPREAAPHPM
jgi:hypothetical protein